MIIQFSAFSRMFANSKKPVTNINKHIYYTNNNTLKRNRIEKIKLEQIISLDTFSYKGSVIKGNSIFASYVQKFA
jgi:hypothetical protein